MNKMQSNMKNVLVSATVTPSQNEAITKIAESKGIKRSVVARHLISEALIDKSDRMLEMALLIQLRDDVSKIEGHISDEDYEKLNNSITNLINLKGVEKI